MTHPANEPPPAASSPVAGRILGALDTTPGQAIAAVLLAVAVFVAFWPGLAGEFLNLDDPKYVTANPNIKLFGRDAIAYAFTTFDNSNWHPLTWLSYALDYQAWGLNPFGFHLTNLLLHVANAVLVFVVLLQLTRSPWRSLVVAVMFALHPMRVESVAWVAERKDVLFAFFWLLTMAAHLVWVRDRKLSSYALVVVFFVLSLMSKPMAITLPAALLLLDYWPLNRFSWRAVLEKLPMVALAAGSALLTVLALRGGHGMEIDAIPLSGRVANAVYSYVRYVLLTFWPDLSPFYSHTALSDVAGTGAMVAAILAFLVATGLIVFYGRSRRYLLVGWLWFLGVLLPSIGLVQAGRQGMADRYSYVAHLGLLILVVWGVAELPLWRSVRARLAGVALVAMIAITLGTLTWGQTQVWHDTLTFWEYTVRKNPRSFMGHQTIASRHARQGRFREAADALQRAAELRSGFPQLFAALGGHRMRAGQMVEAEQSFRQAIALAPDTGKYHGQLGMLLARLGRTEEARVALRLAVELNPSDRRAQRALAGLPAPVPVVATPASTSPPTEDASP